MDQKNNVRVIEEEKFGWTILSTVQDDEHTLSQEKFSAQEEPDPLLGNKTDEGGAMNEWHEGYLSMGRQKGEAQSEESDELEELAREEEDDDGDGGELDDYGLDDGDEAKVLPSCGGSGKGVLWDRGRRLEAQAKQALVEWQPEQKQGLMWSVSLVAMLGFFGWVVMSALSADGKSIRSFKLHPCSIKDGEPVLSTL